MNTPEAVEMRLEIMQTEMIAQRDRERREFGLVGFYMNKFQRMHRQWKYNSGPPKNVYKILGSDRSRMEFYCTREEMEEFQKQWEADWAEEDGRSRILRNYALLKNGHIETICLTRIRCMDALM